jgi:nicotinamidase-related amidase
VHARSLVASPRHHDLHGAVPQRSRVALLLVDVINAMDFPEGPLLAKHALPAAKRIAYMKKRANKARVPIIYANDNFGRWRSDFRATVENARTPGKPGCEIANLLVPDEDDYFVLKPKHSAFYGTSLDLLLRYLGSEVLVLAGFAGDICVLFTAQDAFLRDLAVVVARDATASESVRKNEAALVFMRERLRANIRTAARIDFHSLRTAQATGTRKSA